MEPLRNFLKTFKEAWRVRRNALCPTLAGLRSAMCAGVHMRAGVHAHAHMDHTPSSVVHWIAPLLC